jgi:hypothetical protein
MLTTNARTYLCDDNPYRITGDKHTLWAWGTILVLFTGYLQV